MTHIIVCCVTKLFSRYLVAEHWAFLTACYAMFFFALLFIVRQNKQNAVLALRLQADVGAVR
jgi:hypothetical protein